MTRPEIALEEYVRGIVRILCHRNPNPSVFYEPAMSRIHVALQDGRDQGRIIGKKGAVIEAIGVAVHHAARIRGFTCGVRLEDPESENRHPPMPFKADKNWDRTRLKSFIGSVLEASFLEDVKCIITETGPSGAVVEITAPKNLKEAYSYPDIMKAINQLIYSAGSALGVTAETSIKWE